MYRSAIVDQDASPVQAGWVDLTDRIMRKGAGADLVVYGGGIRLTTLGGQALQRRQSRICESCQATFYYSERDKLLGVRLHAKATWEPGALTAYRASYVSGDKSLKFVSAAIARQIRGAGGMCYFRLVPTQPRHVDAVFEMFHQEYAKDIALVASRPPPKQIRVGESLLTELLE